MSESNGMGIADNPAPEGIADTPAPQGIADEGNNAAGGNEKTEPEAAHEAANNKHEQAAPADWEINAPADFQLPEENIKSFSNAAKKLGLTKEQAEGMLNWHKEFDAAVTTQNEALRNSAIAAWQKEMAADPDFGGENAKATHADAVKALGAFDTDGALRKMLVESGYQWNPAVIKVIARVGRAMGEHQFVGGNGGAKPAKPLFDRMYPDMKV